MVPLIKLVGFIFARLNDTILEHIVWFLAKLFFIFPSSRKETLLSNLRYAFPEWSEGKIQRSARISVARMLEMGFFSLTYPFLSRDRLRRSLFFPEKTEMKLAALRKSKKPVLFLLPHLTLFETLATSSAFRPFGGRRLGAVFRPNRNPKLDRWINSARQATGLVTFSRKEGLLKAKSFLKLGNWLVVLFDQNAGDRGTLDLFFNRLISFTTLPDSLIQSTGAEPVFVFPKRRKFFRSELEIIDLPKEEKLPVSSKAHQLLEGILRSDTNGCPEWLWAHGKWKIHARVESRYQMLVKRKHLIENKEISRRTNFCVRMPNWLGDVIMAIPVLLAIRKGRPDVKFTLICQNQFIPLLEKFELGEQYLALPKQSFGYFYNFKKKLHFLPENYLLFTNSLRGDIEAFLSGARQRFGLKLPDRWRPLLTHFFDPLLHLGPDYETLHQTSTLEQMARHFGLKEQVSKKPLALSAIPRDDFKIGIIPGSSNSPEKRWSSANWSTLINKLKDFKQGSSFHLYGTDQDKDITATIRCSVNYDPVFDHAGKTSLSELAEELASCGLVIGNDTGSMHLANMVGTPVVVLFGPTNSNKTKPFFDSECISIHSPNPSKIDDLSYEDVFELTKGKL